MPRRARISLHEREPVLNAVCPRLVQRLSRCDVRLNDRVRKFFKRHIRLRDVKILLSVRNQADPRVHGVRSAGEKAQHTPGVRVIRGLTQNDTVQRNHGIRTEHRVMRMPCGNITRLSLCKRTRRLISGKPRAHFLEARGFDLKLGNQSGKQLFSAR